MPKSGWSSDLILIGILYLYKAEITENHNESSTKINTPNDLRVFLGGVILYDSIYFLLLRLYNRLEIQRSVNEHSTKL